MEQNAIETVAIVDYGMGNLHSVHQALQRAANNLPFHIVITQDPDEVRQAQRVVLPGQGAMKDCMACLQDTGMASAVRDVFNRQPLLGICVGMQMLLEHSQEHDCPGLGLMEGRVERFDGRWTQEDHSTITVPQMGWNQVWQAQKHDIWNDIPDGSHFYFLHSYYAIMQHSNNIAAQTSYGTHYCSALSQGSVFATQFHPEKSATIGLQLLHNFLVWQPKAGAQSKS